MVGPGSACRRLHPRGECHDGIERLVHECGHDADRRPVIPSPVSCLYRSSITPPLCSNRGHGEGESQRSDGGRIEAMERVPVDRLPSWDRDRGKGGAPLDGQAVQLMDQESGVISAAPATHPDGPRGRIRCCRVARRCPELYGRRTPCAASDSTSASTWPRSRSASQGGGPGRAGGSAPRPRAPRRSPRRSVRRPGRPRGDDEHVGDRRSLSAMPAGWSSRTRS